MSFTITCDKCGASNPVTLKQDDVVDEMYSLFFKLEDVVTVYCCGHDGEIGFKCVCGNKMEETF